MRLRRGVERESCDFCHRRKIKCDRSQRTRLGHDGCSACDLRATPCRMVESDDVRVHRRQMHSTSAVDTTKPALNLVDKRSSSRASRTRSDSLQLSFMDSTSHSSIEASSLLERESQSTQANPSSLSSTTAAFSSHCSPPETLLDLSYGSMLFLDETFMEFHQDASLEDWWTLPEQFQPSRGTERAVPTLCAGKASEVPRDGSNDCEHLWTSCNLEKSTFIAALHAYFDLASLHLPILLEDAFWQDYGSGRCSESLIYALACRGMAYLRRSDTWEIQQRIASRFKGTFFKAQHLRSDENALPLLDDLEALAIMLNFPYSQSHSSRIESHLESLFLTHDSLVLMTLQYRTESHSGPSRESTVNLARLKERKMLLFWHVYGLDAFHCLDHRRLSHISDSEFDESKDMPMNDPGGYLDAILALARIAKWIAQTMCSPPSSRQGVDPDRISLMYKRLTHWQQHSCPANLRQGPEEAGLLSNEDGHSNRDGQKPMSSQQRKDDLRRQLHRAVIWMLDINCRMQIASFVSDYGIREGSTAFAAQIASLMVEQESLRALADAEIICRSIKICSPKEKSNSAAHQNQYHSVADLAPSIVRDVCAGTCFWACQRARSMVQHDPLDRLRTNLACINHRGKEGRLLNSHGYVVQKYARIAQVFRDAVASATSHRDTEAMVNRLDVQIATLFASIASE